VAGGRGAARRRADAAAAQVMQMVLAGHPQQEYRRGSGHQPSARWENHSASTHGKTGTKIAAGARSAGTRTRGEQCGLSVIAEVDPMEG